MKEPAKTISPNLPPWQWRHERSPVHHDPGPALTVSKNSTDAAPCLEDGQDTVVIQTGCVQSAQQLLTPLGSNVPVLPHNQSQVLEDGRKSEVVESQVVVNVPQEMIPASSGQMVEPQAPAKLLESIKRNHELS
jgi:hypothetical protein